MAIDQIKTFMIVPAWVLARNNRPLFDTISAKFYIE